MPTTLLDVEFEKYWPLLTSEQKTSLLNVIKSFVTPIENTTTEQYNKEIDEAVARVEAGEFHTHEEVEKMAEKW